MSNPSTGRVTLPAETGAEDTVVEMFDRWGADYIRDSDGTALSPQILEMGYQIYSTVCIVRADQEYPRANPKSLHQKFLISDAVTATSDSVEIDPLATLCRDKYELDFDNDPKRWWQVIDRTTGEIVPAEKWSVDNESGIVTVTGIAPWHSYTVNVLVYLTWDTTSMYNHIQNNWTTPKVISVDPYHQETWDHLMGFFDSWIDSHKDTDVVRLTTFAYHFCVDSDENAVDKFRDWTGYQDTISIPALEDFEKRFGYALTAEDFVDDGYYNATYRVPTKAYRDWMTFIQDFTVKFGKELVKKVHAAGKKAAIFWGDHWIGAEFYHPSYQEIGIDINIGAVEDGVALRRLSDTPGKLEKEIRLYPYFFPDVFREGGDPAGESISNWAKIRRAMLRMPVDRIGYGGYLSLAAKFPDFVQSVETICNEFREIRDGTDGELSQRLPLKVAVLNCWGNLRAWINYTNPHQKFLDKRPDVTVIAGSNMLECLSGLPVDVTFISFDEIRENGIPADIDVIINDGTGDTAWTGGREWADPAIIGPVREWVANGGGFLGITDPAGHQHNGRYLQLEDVLGVQKETGQSCMVAARKANTPDSHFITDGISEDIQLGAGMSFVYPASSDADVISTSEKGHVQLAANAFANGRGVYLSELPYDLENSRLLLRAIAWAAGKETSLDTLICDNPNTDCAYYAATGKIAVANHTDEPQTTTFSDAKGVQHSVELKPYEMTWVSA
ncbi:1,3-beta-galactosyl-N-acetylhexosamine phosphorylase [Verrucomicrobiaceae bacterium N1E253]|uniref:1,3-beta-galactosyl-N-acetylhexosamine phosphorylase n=1 Tax=Oceaniferula marina TaxID=2748318 RepID=A0A851GFE0_9BACT|nr:1,3-beta-galactosyl-N-acetylhexosamine phosphorylase [Oceaniferula marina]NWK55919.1 1,3-beta-galactosyl-N-acetylhexosamine phosphorylase [Oceaniferula marina]